MAESTSPERVQKTSLRVWPGVAAVVLQWIVRFVVPAVVPGSAPFAIMGGLAGGLIVLIWWLFFSRAPWSERLGGIALIVVVMFATSQIIDESIATGMMGMLFVIYAIPGISLALVAWAVVSRRLTAGLSRAALAAAVVLACGFWALVRTNGLSGNADSDFEWRWAKTPEQKLLVDDNENPSASAASNRSTVEHRPEWPGFRGPDRDSIIRGVRIETDWATSPPAELWRQPIGPAWSSFAVAGDVFYTQEQRGEDELVACYRLSTGALVWKHTDPTRFWESNAGAGPRGTPTLHRGHVYTLGATGILNALDAHSGSVIWSRNAAVDTKETVPDWGISASPLIVGDLVIVAASGTLAGYDRATGNPRWVGPPGKQGYSSPHQVSLNGVMQILMISSAGVTSVAPADGRVLWQHPATGFPIVQPTLTVEGDVLVGTDKGMIRIRPTNKASTSDWTVEELWKSNRLKPYFNDFVIHRGHAYGFDSGVLACMDVHDGGRKWKGGRYGQGQLVLLADQELLLVLAEQGDLALVSATAGEFKELARFPALKGKTWNHPVLVGNTLLVRNDHEMAAFRLAVPKSVL